MNMEEDQAAINMQDIMVSLRCRQTSLRTVGSHLQSGGSGGVVWLTRSPAAMQEEAMLHRGEQTARVNLIAEIMGLREQTKRLEVCVRCVHSCCMRSRSASLRISHPRGKRAVFHAPVGDGADGARQGAAWGIQSRRA